jgi:hypothetical protein
MSGQDSVERRSADRVADSSLLTVSGLSRAGKPFCEKARIKDVSSGGISFVLETPIEAGSLVHLDICSGPGPSDDGSLKFQITGRVLRVCQEGGAEGCFLIAARFEGEIADLTTVQGYESLIRELQLAVEYDESQRNQFE